MAKKKQGQEAEERFLTFSEVQSYLGIKSRKTVLKYIKKGDLPAYKLGGTRWRVAFSDIQEFLADNRITEGHRKARPHPREVEG